MPEASDLNPGDEANPGTAESGEHICPRCSGSGRSSDGPCPECGGSGRIIAVVGDS